MTEKQKQGKQNRRVFTSREKCEAILSVWSEKRSPAEICKELAIPWAVLNQWQEKAMRGMMEALETKRKGGQEQRPVLGSRLEKLLDRTDRRRNGTAKLQKKLKTIQSEAPSP